MDIFFNLKPMLAVSFHWLSIASDSAPQKKKKREEKKKKREERLNTYYSGFFTISSRE